MHALIRFFILIIAIFVSSYIIPGVRVDTFTALIITAIIIGVINTFIKPVLVLLTLPLTVVTFGIFLLILNGALILLVGRIVPGFYVSGLFSAILFSIGVSLVASFLEIVLGSKN